jgi:hypothetical protein
MLQSACTFIEPSLFKTIWYRSGSGISWGPTSGSLKAIHSQGTFWYSDSEAAGPGSTDSGTDVVPTGVSSTTVGATEARAGNVGSNSISGIGVGVGLSFLQEERMKNKRRNWTSIIK